MIHQHFLPPLCKFFIKLQLKRCIARADFKKKRGPSANDMIIGAISSGFIAKNLHEVTFFLYASLICIDSWKVPMAIGNSIH